MSGWFKKEAGFRYRVDGNVGLHYMNGDRDEYREEDESAPSGRCQPVKPPPSSATLAWRLMH